ncbi:MAG: DinB family protein, partial [Acidobacteria bacterium]|nr:DinB family protein [Acidobacteriota bacterium]
MYAATYFPNATSVEDAQPLAVNAGQELFGIDFALVTVETVSISGTVVGTTGETLDQKLVNFHRPDTFAPTQTVPVSPDGQFYIPGLVPGDYELRVIDPERRCVLRTGSTLRSRTVDASEFFLQQYDDVRSIINSMVLTELSDDQMSTPSEAGLNSLVWYLWHVSRWNDIATRVVGEKSEQVLDEHWLRRMNVARRDCGTGMTPDECAAFNSQVDPAGVRAYWDAVGEQVQQVGRSVPSDEWDHAVEDTRLSDVLADGVIGSERARWLESFFA